MTSLEGLEERVMRIEDRNKRVELDKYWETSYLRRILVTAFTYLSVGFYFQAIGVANPWLNAIVPAIAFMLSTLTLPFFKRVWLKHLTTKNTR